MEEAALLDGLDPAQRHAVTSRSRPLVIRAGAGSGKTRVLTRRLAYRACVGDLDPRHALCVTFTREAAAELRRRLRALGLRDLPAAGTFHSIALALLRVRWHDRRTAAPDILPDRAGLVRRVTNGVEAPKLRAVVAEIDWARARGVSVDRYPAAARAARRRPGVDLVLVARAYRDYEAAKRQRRVVDFDDLLERCAEAFERDAAFASAQRWRFRHLFVDEFQDVNPLQFRLLRAWLGDGNGGTDLCAVGDPNQAIYGWNGADPTLLDRLPDLMPGGEVVHLGTNHRSTPQVVAVAAATLASATDAAQAGADHPQAAEHCNNGPVPAVIGCEDAAQEIGTVAGLMRRWHDRGIAWRDQAVLVRSNALAQQLRDGLRAAGVPVNLVVGRGAAHTLPPAATWHDLVELLEPGGEGLASGANMVALAAEYADLDPNPTPAAFAGWLRTVDGSAGPTNAVIVSTFHAAKGREWRAVVVAGVEDGYVPSAGATRAVGGDEAEERRLFYVALSRAAEVLACTWAGQRTFRGEAVTRRPSPYLETVIARCDALRRDDAPAPPPPRPAALACLHDPAGPLPGHDEPATTLRATTLRAWRNRQARAHAIAPTAVVSDATLAALAEDPPADVAALAAFPGVGQLRAARFADTLLAALHPWPA